MARAFHHVPGFYVAELEEDEARLLITLGRDVVQLLDTRDGGPDGAGAPPAIELTSDVGPSAGAEGTEERWWEALGLDDVEPTAAAPERLDAPTDPALARLLPDVTDGEDPEEAARMRAMLEPQVIASKRAALQEAIDLLGRDPLRVTEEAAPRFGAALNDIRLVLAQRLNIEDEADAVRVAKLAESKKRRVDDVDQFMAMLYSFVSWLQESLMTALLKRR